MDERPPVDTPRVSRRWLIIPLVIGAVIFAGYAVLWRIAATSILSGIDEWAAEQRAAGYAVSYDQTRAEGFPFLLRIMIDGPSVSVPDVGEYHGEGLALDALPYDINRIIASPFGAHEINTAEIGHWRIEGETLRGEIARHRQRGWIATASAVKLRLNPLGGGADISVDRTLINIAPDAAEQTSLTVSLISDRMILDPSNPSKTIDHVEAAFAVSQFQTLENGVGAWRAAGGQIDIQGAGIAVNDGKATTRGQLRVDEKGDLNGAMTAAVSNPLAFKDALVAFDVMSPGEADETTAQLTLAAIAQGGQAKGTFSFADGAITLLGKRISSSPRIKTFEE